MPDENSFLLPTDTSLSPYSRARWLDRTLNAAIMRADISRSYEVLLELFDAFYADDVEVSSESHLDLVSGKLAVRAIIADFLMPLHVMAEIGGLLISIRQTPMPGDSALETNSEWTLDLVGVTGATCTLKWRTLRKWRGSFVTYEHHYDIEQHGGPLTDRDLNFTTGRKYSWA